MLDIIRCENVTTFLHFFIFFMCSNYMELNNWFCNFNTHCQVSITCFECYKSLLTSFVSISLAALMADNWLDVAFDCAVNMGGSSTPGIIPTHIMDGQTAVVGGNELEIQWVVRCAVKTYKYIAYQTIYLRKLRVFIYTNIGAINV